MIKYLILRKLYKIVFILKLKITNKSYQKELFSKEKNSYPNNIIFQYIFSTYIVIIYHLNVN